MKFKHEELLSFMERSSNKPSIIINFINELPLTDFWQSKFSDPKTNFLWKYHGEYNGHDCYVIMDMNEELNFIPFIMVTSSVREYVIKEIYKIENEDTLEKI